VYEETSQFRCQTAKHVAKALGSSETSTKMSSIPPPTKATEAKELLHNSNNSGISKAHRLITNFPTVQSRKVFIKTKGQR
jgi:hypothetical protein